MKISRDKLVNIIRESISRVLLKEYGGEQLVLPFDGDSRSYNYMQYIDFVKSITTPGEIRSNIHSIDDYYSKMNIDDEVLFEVGRDVEFYDGYACDEFNEEEYNYFIGELEDKYGKEIYQSEDDIELSEYGDKCYKKELISRGKWWIQYMVNKLFDVSEDGMVYINRVLNIPKAMGRYNMNNGRDNSSVYNRETGAYYEDDDEYPDLYSMLSNNYGDLGSYWAYGKDTGSAYCGDYFRDGTSSVSLIAMTPIENINMAGTCSMNNAGEFEVSLKDNSLIMLVGMTIDGHEINIGHRVYK